MSKVEGGGRVDVAAGGGTDGVADGIVYNCYGENAVIVVFLSGLEILLARSGVVGGLDDCRCGDALRQPPPQPFPFPLTKSIGRVSRLNQKQKEFQK